MAKQDDWVRLTVRLPPDVYARLNEVVATGPNSMNAEIVARLEESFGPEDISGHIVPAKGIVFNYDKLVMLVADKYEKLVKKVADKADIIEAENQKMRDEIERLQILKVNDSAEERSGGDEQPRKREPDPLNAQRRPPDLNDREPGKDT